MSDNLFDKNVAVPDLLLALTDAAVEIGLLEVEDRIYAYNRLLSVLNLEECPVTKRFSVEEATVHTTGELIRMLVEWAISENIIEDRIDHCEILTAELMDCLMPRPSEVNRRFWQLYTSSPAKATDWFYHFSQISQYIQVKQIEKNIRYQAICSYGMLDITINLSKPEKNPTDIAAAGLIRSANYPCCLLCPENEGYRGRIQYPARSNHRLIRLPDPTGEPWYLQYSPYSYYPEHCIVLSGEHRPMKIDRRTFDRLLSFLDVFPDYFIGSNADLPIVGGSILSHDHYQGGRYSFAMEQAPVEEEFELPFFLGIRAGIVRWPLSVLRLISSDREGLAACADRILLHWRTYSDPDVHIQAFTKNTPHNTITPIARMKQGRYEMDLVLRNNRSSSLHPLGIFHPHQEVHHIKQENIGLIEAMGLAVLPARLLTELEEVASALAGRSAEVADIHDEWLQQLIQKYGIVPDRSIAREVVRQAVAEKFEQVLADAGVFKRDASGRSAFRSYLRSLAATIQTDR